MKLRFYSRQGHLVPLQQIPGQIARYVGREFVPPEKGVHAGGYKPADKPFEVDERTHAKLAKRLRRKCGEGSLLPADEATARRCRVPWVEPEQLAGGEWQITGYVEGWCDWPSRPPDKLEADLAKQRGGRAGVKAQQLEAAKRGDHVVEEVATHG
jgi:hypothetical protein